MKNLLPKLGAYLLAMLLLSLSGWGIYHWWSPEAHPLKRPLIVAVSKTPLSAPIYIADAMGFIDNHCVNIQLDEVIGGNRSLEAVLDGNAAFATTSDSVIVFKSAELQGFVNLSTFVQSDNDVKVIAHPESGIHTGADLPGKRIGVIRGTASEYFLSMLLAYEDISPAQVELVNMRPDEMPMALTMMKVDAVVVWEPFAYKTVTMMDNHIVQLSSKSLYTLTFNLLANADLVNSHAEETKCFLTGLDRAIDFISADPEQAQQILGERLGLDKEFTQWIWHDYLFKLSLTQSLLMNIESQAEWAAGKGMISREELPNYRDMLDARFLLEVKPSAVSVGLRDDY